MGAAPQVVTSNWLARLRNTHAALTSAAERMRLVGLDPSAVVAEAAAMTAVAYMVMVPCLLCSRRFPVDVLLTEWSWPQACICGDHNL